MGLCAAITGCFTPAQRVAEFGSLEHMDARSLKRAALTFIVQCALMLLVVVFDQSELRWLAGIFAVSFWLLPFVGYIVALYRAPMFSRWSPALRTACVTVVSLVVSVVSGFAIFLFVPLMGIPISPH